MMRTVLLLAAALSPTLALAQQDARLGTPADLRPYAPGTPQYGAGGTPTAPGPAILQQDDDWSWIADVPDAQRGTIDRLRWRDLGDGVALSFGLDARLLFEFYEDQAWGTFPGSDDNYHLRINPHASLVLGDRARLYGALKFGQVENRRFAVPPIDDDGPDIHQLFAELSFGDALGLDVNDAFVRVGRQELHYGRGRLISIRQGPNVRSDFDGVLGRVRMGRTIADAFALRPSETRPGAWNDRTDHTEALWGIYGTTAPREGSGGPSVDWFYVGQRDEEATYAFAPGPSEETRHTVGIRLWSGGPPTEGLNYDVEAHYQFGSTDLGTASDISAWTVAATATYGWADAPMTPVLTVRAGVTSGDDDPADGTLGTYRAPAPPGRFFGDGNPLGPGNVAGIGAYLGLTPAEGWDLSFGAQSFWAVESSDGLYSPGRTPVAGPSDGASHVGVEYAISYAYEVRPGQAIRGRVARFDAGGYFDDPGAGVAGRDITYVDLAYEVSF